MSIQFNPNLQSPAIQGPLSQPGIRQEGAEQTKFGDALLNSFRQVNQAQPESNQSIVDLLSGKQQDINGYELQAFGGRSQQAGRSL